MFVRVVLLGHDCGITSADVMFGVSVKQEAPTVESEIKSMLEHYRKRVDYSLIFVVVF